MDLLENKLKIVSAFCKFRITQLAIIHWSIYRIHRCSGLLIRDEIRIKTDEKSLIALIGPFTQQ